MILPDVNVLVYAFRRESPRHEHYRDWLASALHGGEDVALVDSVLLGVVRVATNPRIFADPAPTATALDFVAALTAASSARPISYSDSAWRRFDELVRSDRHIRGNLVPDAFLAATALTAGARIATSDAGFARFPGLRWFDPGAASD